MKKYCGAALLLCLTGCMGNMGLSSLADSEININQLTKISQGMSEREVCRIMRKPFDYKTICIGEDVYDIWFYVTSPTVLGQSRMVPQNLTPLSFKNGVLLGRGYPIYDSILQLKAAAPKSETPSDQREEDRAIEKALEAMNRSTPPPPPMTRTLDEEDPPDEDNPADHPTPKTQKPSKQKAFDKEGERMNEDASEQDFDFW